MAETEVTDNNATMDKSANGFRLPFESEWEWATRGGQNFTYTGSDNLDDVGWCGGNSGIVTHPVGQKDKMAMNFSTSPATSWSGRMIILRIPDHISRGPTSALIAVGAGTTTSATVPCRPVSTAPLTPTYFVKWGPYPTLLFDPRPLADCAERRVINTAQDSEQYVIPTLAEGSVGETGRRRRPLSL